MMHLALSPRDAATLHSILEAKLVDLQREIAHTDTRSFRHALEDIAVTVEGLIEQLSLLGGTDGASAIPSPISRYLRSRGVNYAVIHHKVAYTAPREAAAAHVPGREWAKTVVCIADDKPALAVVPADCIVDMSRLRGVIGAQRLRLATEKEIGNMYGDCELGAMPPLGPLYDQPVLVDEAMASNVEIAFNAGSHGDAIRMRYRDFEHLVKPTVARFANAH